jgi:hypothetical protein
LKSLLQIIHPLYIYATEKNARTARYFYFENIDSNLPVNLQNSLIFIINKIAEINPNRTFDITFNFNNPFIVSDLEKNMITFLKKDENNNILEIK